MNFNLLTEPWIPALFNDGRWERVGIQEVFKHAGRIRQIAAANPMDRFALLRFLLALLYWCKGNPCDEPILDDETFPGVWFSKLNSDPQLFDLFGPGPRFYQDPSAQRLRPATELIQEVPTGNNYWHLRHSTDSVEGLCPGCCAFGLLRLPLYTLSGRPDMMAGINGTPPVYAMPLGQNLMQTLMLNWIPASDLGTPAWTDPGIRPLPGKTVPVLLGLTLLSRRVWLGEPIETSSACIACGRRDLPLCQTCEFQSAGKQQNELWDDPHVLYPSDGTRKAPKAANLTAPGQFRMDRPWTNLLQRLLGSDRRSYDAKGRSVFVVGFAVNKAQGVDVWERTVELPPSISVSPSAPSRLVDWNKQGNRLAERLPKRAGKTQEQAIALVASVRPHVEHQVSLRTNELLGEGDAPWDAASGLYQPLMAAVARSISPGFTSSFLHRRRQITNTMPCIRDTPPPAPRRRQTKRKS